MAARRRSNKPTETPLVNACIVVLRSRGVQCWRQNQGGVPIGNRFVRFTRGMPGISDIIGIMPDGQFCAVECKRMPNKLTPDQATFLQIVAKHGGFACVAYSVDDVLEALEDYPCTATPSAPCSRTSDTSRSARASVPTRAGRG